MIRNRADLFSFKYFSASSFFIQNDVGFYTCIPLYISLSLHLLIYQSIYPSIYPSTNISEALLFYFYFCLSFFFSFYVIISFLVTSLTPSLSLFLCLLLSHTSSFSLPLPSPASLFLQQVGFYLFLALRFYHFVRNNSSHRSKCS